MSSRSPLVVAGLVCLVATPAMAQRGDTLARPVVERYQAYVHAPSERDSIDRANAALTASRAVLQRDSSNIPALIISAELLHARGDSVGAYRAVARALVADPETLRHARANPALPQVAQNDRLLRALFSMATAQRDWPFIAALGPTVTGSNGAGANLAYLGAMFRAYQALQRPGQAAAVLARAAARVAPRGQTWRHYVGYLRRESDSVGGILPLIQALAQRHPRDLVLKHAALTLAVDAQQWADVLTAGAALVAADSAAADLAYYATVLTAYLALQDSAHASALVAEVAARFPAAGAPAHWYARELYLGEPSGGLDLVRRIQRQNPANPLLPQTATVLDSALNAEMENWVHRNPFSHHPLQTPWARQVSAARVLPEYPRPQLVRPRWRNLNGRWDYAIRDSAAGVPIRYDGTMLVPFPVESPLSGVGRPVTDVQYLWYRRTFRTPRLASGERLLLHFGAVDWEATVTVNGKQIGHHRGGYDPFSFDITDALTSSGKQELVVRVWDPTERDSWLVGKQRLRPAAITLSPTTGIWQTVWLEPVPRASVRALEITPDIDAGVVRVRTTVTGAGPDERVRVAVSADARTVGIASGVVDEVLTVPVPKARLWSPDDPFLYDLTVSLASGDRVTSYVGMRKIAVGPDSAGTSRLLLNGRPLFQLGVLDQGMWPDGFYTAPTDEALAYDIAQAKRMGFNLIRKHVKVEPARWYYHADRLGMLVWQDMPSMGRVGGPDGQPNPAAVKAQFAAELEHVVTALRNHPSIVMWILFNEGGDHDPEKYFTWLRTHDPTRLIDVSSGGADAIGDVADWHVYPDPPGTLSPNPSRTLVLGEFGGLGLVVPDHLYSWSDETFSNRGHKTAQDLGEDYRRMIRQLRELKAQGLAAAVYTQLTDTEAEVNGLLTYDRALVKVPAAVLRENEALYEGTAPRTTRSR